MLKYVHFLIKYPYLKIIMDIILKYIHIVTSENFLLNTLDALKTFPSNVTFSFKLILLYMPIVGFEIPASINTDSSLYPNYFTLITNYLDHFEELHT